VAPEPDYSRAALARFIEFVVDKSLVHPATAQGWRVATTKVLEDLPVESRADVRRIDVDVTFREFLHRNPGRLSPASVGEYRRRVGRAIEEFVRWVEDPGGYAFRGATRRPRPSSRRSSSEPGMNRRPNDGSRDKGDGDRGEGGAHPAFGSGVASGSAAARSGGAPGGDRPGAGIALAYPLRPDLLAEVVVPRDLTVEEARRMGAFLVTLAVDFKPAPSGDR
jgi:hypothetical protein